MFNKIALVGGTHGNETSGIQLIRNWQAFGLPSRFSTLNVSLNIANEAALEANVRFVEEDLKTSILANASGQRGELLGRRCRGRHLQIQVDIMARGL